MVGAPLSAPLGVSLTFVPGGTGSAGERREGGLVLDLGSHDYTDCVLELDMRIEAAHAGVARALRGTRLKLEPFPGDATPELSLTCYGGELGSDWTTIRVPMKDFRVPLGRIAQLVTATTFEEPIPGAVRGVVEIRNVRVRPSDGAGAALSCGGGLFGELWAQSSFRTSNLAERAPLGVSDFPLQTTSFRGGWRQYVSGRPGLTRSRWSLDAYVVGEHIHDFDYVDRPRLNVNDLRFQVGGGVRLRFEHDAAQGPQVPCFLGYALVDVYAEGRRQGSFVDDGEDLISRELERSDFQTGMRIWMSGKFQETYVDIRFSKTAFGPLGDGPFLVVTASPRALLPLHDRVQLYANGEIVYDVLGEPFNRLPHSRNLKGFLGGRVLLPLGFLGLRNAGLLAFAEHGWVHWLVDPKEAFANPDLELHDTDTRFGLTLWLPLGESVYRPLGQIFGG